MWLFFVETYLFVLAAFAVGVAAGLTGVRLGVRRIAPPRGPKASKPAKPAKAEKRKRGAVGEATEADPAAPAAAEPAVTGETA